VGRSTAADVISELGPPSRIDKSIGAEFYYYQGGPYTWAAHMITIRANTVDQIKEDMAVYDPRQILLSQFTDRYGSPDRVFWSSLYSMERVLIYSRQGILLEVMGSRHDPYVTTALYYQPCSMICVQIKFGSMFSSSDPFPDDDVGGVLDPWEFTKTP
jgi:hypothetical protein